MKMLIPSKGNKSAPLQAIEWISVEKHASSAAKRVQTMIHSKYILIARSTLYSIYKEFKLTK